MVFIKVMIAALEARVAARAVRASHGGAVGAVWARGSPGDLQGPRGLAREVQEHS